MVNHWIQKDPQVIALLLLEQRVQHIVFAEYLLTIVDYLEAIVPPEELYSALGKQMKLNQDAFMDWVLERHPSALWLVGLFSRIRRISDGVLSPVAQASTCQIGRAQEIYHCGVCDMLSKVPKMVDCICKRYRKSHPCSCLVWCWRFRIWFGGCCRCLQTQPEVSGPGVLSCKDGTRSGCYSLSK